MKHNYPQLNLTNKEWNEIVTLDYVLTWRYTDDYERDLKRYKELTEKRWKGFDILNYKIVRTT